MLSLADEELFQFIRLLFWNYKIIKIIRRSDQSFSITPTKYKSEWDTKQNGICGAITNLKITNIFSTGLIGYCVHGLSNNIISISWNNYVVKNFYLKLLTFVTRLTIWNSAILEFKQLNIGLEPLQFSSTIACNMLWTSLVFNAS